MKNSAALLEPRLKIRFRLPSIESKDSPGPMILIESVMNFSPLETMVRGTEKCSPGPAANVIVSTSDPLLSASPLANMPASTSLAKAIASLNETRKSNGSMTSTEVVTTRLRTSSSSSCNSKAPRSTAPVPPIVGRSTKRGSRRMSLFRFAKEA